VSSNLTTDRGPNVDYPPGTPDGKLFPAPWYAPRIGRFTISGNAVRLSQSIDLKAEQFVYLLENPNTLSSEIVAIDEETFLVLERDGDFPGANPAAIKRIYRISTAEPAPATLSRSRQPRSGERVRRWGIAPLSNVAVRVGTRALVECPSSCITPDSSLATPRQIPPPARSQGADISARA
jgi:hypothetical protein